MLMNCALAASVTKLRSHIYHTVMEMICRPRTEQENPTLCRSAGGARLGGEVGCHAGTTSHKQFLLSRAVFCLWHFFNPTKLELASTLYISGFTLNGHLATGKGRS